MSLLITVFDPMPCADPVLLSSFLLALKIIVLSLAFCPDDGTTANGCGQLPSRINMGLTSRECHTTGMHDPPQYMSSLRNSVMKQNSKY